MQPLAPSSPKKRPSTDEIKGLARALDKAYTRLRERARAEWKRHHSGSDPADACVSVRIAATDKVPDVAATPKARSNSKARPLTPKKKPSRKKTPRAKDRRAP